MQKVKNSLEVKINVIFSALMLFILLYAGISIYNQLKLQETVKEEMKQTLMATAKYVAGQIDGDEYATLKKGDENTAIYKKYHAICNAAVKFNPNVLWVYTFNRLKEDPKKIYWVIDNTMFEDPDASKIGEVYDTPSETNLAGLEATAVEPDFLTDEWGTFISGYSPIFNKKGQSVGAVGVDITKSTFLSRQNSLWTALNILLFLLFFAAAIVLTVGTKKMIKDLESLTNTVNAISKGDFSQEIKIDRNDEIGDLAASFRRMVASIKIILEQDK